MNTISNWKRFELLATNYLQENYGDYALFEQQGGADSTIPDILVTTKKEKFYIETKSSEAQSGQFVILPNNVTNEFYFSEKNKTEENKLTQIIIDYMNNNWESYKNVSTEGLSIDMSDSIFANWITNYYKYKNVKYFISGLETNFVIIPIDDFSLSKDDQYQSGYRISVRSNTNNPNIIFSIKLKPNVVGISHSSFISQLK